MPRKVTVITPSLPQSHDIFVFGLGRAAADKNRGRGMRVPNGMVKRVGQSSANGKAVPFSSKAREATAFHDGTSGATRPPVEANACSSFVWA
jgi:hypothetical protein